MKKSLSLILALCIAVSAVAVNFDFKTSAADVKNGIGWIYSFDSAEKIENFDNEEFFMETTLGYLAIKGEDLEIIKRLGFEKRDVVVFEDAHHAVVTAKAANYRVVAVREDTELKFADVIKINSDIYVETMTELIGE